MPKNGYLDRLCVHKDYQGQGVATSLCDRLETRFPVSHITTHASLTAKPFFESRGYRLLNEQHVERKGVFLTTEQRFPGIGNGVLQDILLAAGIHPKRKIGTFSDLEQDNLLSCIISVLGDMTEGGGRDTEKDIFGRRGGYRVRLSKNTLVSGCPQCRGQLVKETYMGGSIYYCPSCQPLVNF